MSVSAIEVIAPRKLFEPGDILATAGVHENVSTLRQRQIVSQHINGDWGNLAYEDTTSNLRAVAHGGRIFSAYPCNPDEPDGGNIYVITEADRSATTLLLPHEY